MNYIKILNINELGYGQSIIHKLYPLNKLLILIINYILMFNLSNTGLRIYVILLIVLMALTCISIKSLLKFLFFSLFFMVGFIVMVLLLNFDNKVSILISIYFKVLSMTLPLIFYSLTTPLKQSIYNFETIFKPLELFKINTNVINLTLNIIISYIPIVLIEFDQVLLIKAAKGEDIKESNIFKKVKIIYDSLFIILINSLIKANQMVEAILIRRFVFNKKRSRFITYKLKRIDYICWLILVLILSLLLL